MSDALSSWTVLSVLSWTAQHFEKHGLESPRLDAEVLLAFVLGLPRVQLYVQFDRPLNAQERASYRSLVSRRLLGEPVAYLLGEREFYGMKFLVSPDVLIPRPETELLVDLLLEELSKKQQDPHSPLTLLDLGTGSGCIPITLASKTPTLRALGADISDGALKVASQNALKQGVEGRVRFEKIDFFSEEVPFSLLEKFDFIVSNPPYIPTRKMEDLARELHFEPRSALDGGPDGLSCYPAVLKLARRFLKPEGFVFLEIGEDQTGPIREISESLGYQFFQVFSDLAGWPRVLKIGVF